MREIGHDQLGAGTGPRHAGPAQQPAQPGDDLLQAERLGDVVVAARRDAAHPVLHGVPGGEEQHADMRQDPPHPAQYLKSVEIRQHDVQQDRVRLELACRPDGAAAVRGRPDLPALVAQHAGEQLGQAGLVVDDEHPDGRAVGALQAAIRPLVRRCHGFHHCHHVLSLVDPAREGI